MSFLKVNDFVIANVIALVLFIGVAQLLYVPNSIINPFREAEEFILQLAQGNLNIMIVENMVK